MIDTCRLIFSDIVDREKIEEVSHYFEDVQEIAQVGTWTYHTFDQAFEFSVSTGLFSLPVEMNSFPGKMIAKYVHPDDMKIWKELNLKFMKTGNPFQHDIRFILSEGKHIWMKLSGRGFYNDQGQLYQIVGTAQDISNEKVEQVRLETILNAGELGAWEWCLESGEASFDRNMCEMLGYQQSEMKKKSESWREMIHPEDRTKTLKKFQKFLHQEVDTFEMLIRMEHRDGHYIPILNKAKIIQSDSNGLPSRVLCTLFDFSDMQRLQDAAADKDLLLEEIQADAKLGGWMVDLDDMKPIWTDETYRMHNLEPQSEIDIQGSIECYLMPGRERLEAMSRIASKVVNHTRIFLNFAQ